MPHYLVPHRLRVMDDLPALHALARPWSSRMNVLRTSITAAHAPDRLRETIARFAAGAVHASFSTKRSR